MLIQRNKLIILIITAVLAVIIIISTAIISNKNNKLPKELYEVAIMVRDQPNSGTKEDERNSLKRGDVLVLQKEGHSWSKTESISYLILKMNLDAEQVQKLTRPKTRELAFEELSEEERGRIDEERRIAEIEGREYIPESKEEVLLAREYAIDFTKVGEFNDADLILRQPFEGEVFDWNIVIKK